MLKNDVPTSSLHKRSISSAFFNTSPFRFFKNILSHNGVQLKISVSILPSIIDSIERNPYELDYKVTFFVNNRYYHILYTDNDGIATCQNIQTGQQTIFHVLKIVHLCLVLDPPEKIQTQQLSFF